MRFRRLISAVCAVLLGATGVAVLLPATPAAAASPTRILNTGSGGGLPNWLETQSVPDGNEQGGRKVGVTFVAEHVQGRRITTIRVNKLDGGSQDFAVTPQIYPGGTTNGLETSRVSLVYDPGSPGGFSCPVIGGATRRRGGLTQTFRVIDSAGEVSAPVSFGNFFSVENGDCLGRTDFIDIYDQFQSATSVAPGDDVTFSFQGDDADNAGDNDHFDRYRPRLRRLNDGLIVNLAEQNPGGDNDNDELTFTTDFPSRGRWVVEIEPGGETNYNESGTFFRLGAVDVNQAAAPTASIAFTSTGTIFGSTPPSVNAGTPVNAVLTAGDTGGAVQIAEWDATNDGTFERTEYTVPTSGSVSHPALSSTELTQSVSTTTHGLKTVRARATDNGAIDGSDNIRKQTTTSSDLKVNAIPTANNQTVGTFEDNAVNFALTGGDADNQPTGLQYELVTSPPGSAGTVSCPSLPACTFTPSANFNGSTSFTFRTKDGPSGLNAWSNSIPATVTINVAAVNDAPTANAQSVTTAEDTSKSITLTGSDIEPGTLTFGIVSGPSHGTLTGTGANRTYNPALNFHGTDSFVFSVTDSGSLVGTATVNITVTPVNDAPTAVDQSINTDEDTSVNFSLAAGDVDGDTVMFSAPTSGPSNGGVSCLGAACTYTPNGNFNGTDSFTFTTNDGSGTPNATDVGTITINVAPVNDAPEAEAQSVTLDEDTPTGITLGATDVDGDPLAFDVIDGPSHGSTTPQGGAVVEYSPDANYFGGDQFEFEADDGDLSDTAIVVLTINPVNDAPTVEDQSFSTDEDTAVIISAVASDIDGDALTYGVVSGPANGSLTGSLPDIGYLPAANFHGTDSFVISVSDGQATVQATITVTVAPVNDAPVAEAVNVTTPEDTSTPVTLSGTDVDGDTLTFTVTSTTTNGTLGCAGAACTYLPAGNFHGSDLAIFEVGDGTVSDTASVSITVTPVNDPPNAPVQTVATSEDTPVGVGLFANDVDGDTLTFEVTSPPTEGSLTGTAPTFVYSPNPNYNGGDTIGFSVSDGTATTTGIVLLEIQAVNDAPDAIDASASTDEDTAVGFEMAATDVDSTVLTFTVGTPTEGIVDCTGTVCTYTPAQDFHGLVTFGFDVSDGDLSDGGLVTITVASDNDAPAAADSTVPTAEDTPVGVPLVATDVDGDALSYQVLSPPTSGTLTGTAPELTYSPGSNVNGTDAFTWQASDGNGGSVTATVTIVVAPVNDAPSALDRIAETNEDTQVTFALLATDVEGDPITYSVDVAPAPAQGTVTITGSSATFMPAQDFTGSVSFTYRASDPSGASSTAQVTVLVHAVPLIGTGLVGDAAVARVQVNLAGNILAGGVTVFPLMRATLRTSSGAPLAGKTITFYIGANTLCSAVTNAQGVGECSTQAAVASLLNLGYQVRFDGDTDHAASSTRGPILQVLQLRL